MSRKTCFWLICALVATVACGGVLSLTWHGRPEYNLLLVTLDTTRADHLGCYGDRQALTPVLDSLAANGVLFERAYAAIPLTLPSHATLFTGLYPPEHGLRANGGQRLGDQIPTLAEILAVRGLATAAFIGSFVLDSRFGLDRGFETYADEFSQASSTTVAQPLERGGDAVVDQALSWLRTRPRRPFFCWVHLYDPHQEYLAHPELFGDRFREQPYAGEIAFVDVQIGRLVKFLQEQDLDRHTVVVIVGDHGEGLGMHDEIQHGTLLYNTTLQVPLIASLPGEFQPGHRVKIPVSLADLFPTLLDLLAPGTKVASSGRSLMPALQGKQLPEKFCYAETEAVDSTSGPAPLESLILERWKLIRSSSWELYDLLTDRDEQNNLSESHPAELRSLQEALAALRRQLVVREAPPVRLSPAEERGLASLGYAGHQHSVPEKSPTPEDLARFQNQLQVARELVEKGDAEGAIAQAELVLSAAPDFEPARRFLTEAHFQLGLASVQKEQFAVARAHFAEVQRLAPNHAAAAEQLRQLRERLKAGK